MNTWCLILQQKWSAQNKDQQTGSQSADPWALNQITKPRTVSCPLYNAHHFGSHILTNQAPFCACSAMQIVMIQQECQVRPLRSDPSMFTRSVEPLNHSPYMHLYTALTLNIWKPNSRKPSVPTISWYSDTDQQKAKLLWILSQWQPHQTRTIDLKLQTHSIHSFSTSNLLLPPTQMQSKAPTNTHSPWQILPLSSTGLWI
jgi:hypothetical protein